MNPPPDDATKQLLAQLADIHGLDPVSMWPLAPGWWMLLGVVLCLLLVVAIALRRRNAYRHSWRRDAVTQLSAMKKQLNDHTAARTLAELSSLLRRIAVQRFSRAACAGLEGEAWIAWLEAHDPKQFGWKRYGALLTQSAYAPADAPFDSAGVKRLIDATREWVR